MADGTFIESDDLFRHLNCARLGNAIIAVTPLNWSVPDLFCNQCLCPGRHLDRNRIPTACCAGSKAFRMYRFWHPYIVRGGRPIFDLNLDEAQFLPEKLSCRKMARQTSSRFRLTSKPTFRRRTFSATTLPPGIGAGTPRAFTDMRVWHMGIILAALLELGLDLNKLDWIWRVAKSFARDEWHREDDSG